MIETLTTPSNLADNLISCGDPRETWKWRDREPDYVRRFNLDRSHVPALLDLVRRWFDSSSLSVEFTSSCPRRLRHDRNADHTLKPCRQPHFLRRSARDLEMERSRAGLCPPVQSGSLSCSRPARPRKAMV